MVVVFCELARSVPVTVEQFGEQLAADQNVIICTPMFALLAARVAWLLRLKPELPSTIIVGCVITVLSTLIIERLLIVTFPSTQAFPSRVISQLLAVDTLPVMCTFAGQLTF